ncbi:MAG TPA: hypothetical protein VJR27_03745 [Candidatus Saccharimonadales bacterium]|nr:hypothetical protein [Candidatus Saccharimonadales bacterium]
MKADRAPQKIYSGDTDNPRSFPTRVTATSVAAGLLLSACAPHAQSDSSETKYLLPTVGIVEYQQSTGPRIGLCAEQSPDTYSAFFADKKVIDTLQVSDQEVHGKDKAGYYDLNNMGISSLQQNTFSNGDADIDPTVSINPAAALQAPLKAAAGTVTKLFCQMNIPGNVEVSETDPSTFNPTGQREPAAQLAPGTLVEVNYGSDATSFEYEGGKYIETTNPPQIESVVSLLPPQNG